MKRAVLSVLFCIIVAVIASCGNKETSLIKEDEMKLVVWDMMCADTWYDQISLKDTAAKAHHENFKLYEKVFAAHHITKENFYETYKYYQARPDKMKVLLDSVEAYGNKVKNIPIPEPKTQKVFTVDSLKTQKPILVNEDSIKKPISAIKRNLILPKQILKKNAKLTIQ